MKTKLFALLCTILLLPWAATAADGKQALAIENISYLEIFPGDIHVQRDNEGYLDNSAQETEEFVYIDIDKGQWLYLTPTLQVEIIRYKGTYNRKPIIWYISQIQSRDEVFTSFCANPEKPAKKLLRPELIAQKHKVVYAQNGDYFTYRLARDKKPGVIIRSGKIIYNKTNKKISTGLPPLDELSLYEDGTFELRYPGELSAQDYIDRGAVDVFSFGPALIVDGEIDSRLAEKYRAREPRSAIGMIRPGHYVGFYIEARNKRSYGCDLELVAQILKNEGCSLAFNLDGGQTSAMVFMGKTVMQGANYNGFTNTRNQQDIIGIGFSEQVSPKK